MPSFEVLLNDKPIVVAGGHDLDLLVLGVLSVPTTPLATLQITSMKKLTSEHDIWINHPLVSRDMLTITLRRDDFPISPRRSEATLSYSDAQASGRSRSTCFTISTPDKSSIFARVDDDSTLHIAATWIKSKDRCCLEIACIRMTESGQNEMWLENDLEFDRPFRIELSNE